MAPNRDAAADEYAPGLQMATDVLKRMNGCASEDTKQGDDPRPQYLGFVWSRKLAAEAGAAFKALVAEVPAIQFVDPTAEAAAALTAKTAPAPGPAPGPDSAPPPDAAAEAK